MKRLLRRFIAAAATVAITRFFCYYCWFSSVVVFSYVPSVCPLESRWGATHSLFFTFNSLTLENSPEIVGIVCNILLALFQSTMGREKKENIMNRVVSLFFVLTLFCSVLFFIIIMMKLIANDSFATQFI